MIIKAKRFPRALAHRARNQVQTILWSRLDRCLKQSGQPSVLDDDEAEFERLQAEFPEKPAYGYDPASVWTRASQRGMAILAAAQEAEVKPRRILEAGCGDGSLGFWLTHAGCEHVQLTDLEDWRHDISKHLPFAEAALEAGLPFEDDSFDVVVTFNSFEHFRDPAACLRELLRVTRPGGLHYHDFCPLYNSAWGLHAYRFFRFPYPQFLFSKAFLKDKIEEMRACATGKCSPPPYVNGWAARAFDRLFRVVGDPLPGSGRTYGQAQASFVNRYLPAFRGRALTADELCTHGYIARFTAA
ncbi:MAG: class I SAM-dependent methyltransferase [Verrucomicrobiota bacterium]